MQPYLYLEQVERRIEYRFKDRSLLRAALTHRSACADGARGESNEANYERLEFEGDAILGARVAQYLVRTYPSLNEGEMTRKRSELTSNARLGQIARELGLTRYINFGSGQGSVSAKADAKVPADVVEALIGAIARDGGVTHAERFINRTILKLKEAPSGVLGRFALSASIATALTKARGAGFEDYLTEKGKRS